MQRGSALRGIVALLASIGLLAALGAGPVSAEVLEDQVAADPGELYRFQLDAGSANYHGMAQTVTVGTDGYLVAVDLYLAREEWTTVDLIFEIRRDTPDGSLLATSDPIPASDIVDSDTVGEWELVTFSSPPWLNAGDVIAITTRIPDPLPGGDPAGPAWYWAWSDAGGSDPDDYPAGVAWGGYRDAGGVHWAGWSDGSDLAFVTYMAVGEPTCQISAWIEDERLAEPIEVVEGTTFDIWFEDFPPFGDFTITWDHEGYDLAVDEDVADAFGDSWWYYETAPGDAGLLTITATAADPACESVLAVTIVPAPVPATPTPIPPTPTPAPTGSAGGITLPPTTTAGETPSGGASVLPALLVLGATVGVLVVASRRLSPTLPDRR